MWLHLRRRCRTVTQPAAPCGSTSGGADAHLSRARRLAGRALTHSPHLNALICVAGACVLYLDAGVHVTLACLALLGGAVGSAAWLTAHKGASPRPKLHNFAVWNL